LNIGAGLGFSDGFGGFGGGVSVDLASSDSSKTLLDMNKDGKPDVVYYSDGLQVKREREKGKSVREEKKGRVKYLT
jgi:hypothetical protein